MDLFLLSLESSTDQRLVNPCSGLLWWVGLIDQIAGDKDVSVIWCKLGSLNSEAMHNVWNKMQKVCLDIRSYCPYVSRF